MEDIVRMQAMVLLLFIGYVTLELCNSESPWIYNLGGAPLVFRSQDYCTNCSFSNQHLNCQSSMLQGWRKYQEDRLFCDLNICIPFFGKNGVKEVPVGMAAVFDGHVGAEASEMASKLVLDYFLLHSRFIQNESRMLDVVPDESMHLEILKEALVRTIRDIDITFTKEASKNGIAAGSTAAIVVIAYNQILVANVGDSKVVLCSQKILFPRDITGILTEYRGRRRRRRNIVKFATLEYYKNLELSKVSEFKFLSGKELTRDHHPDREDERRRIEVAGGFVTSEYYDVPRVNGQLAVSRAIGDIYYKSSGVIAVPEITDWKPLTRNDSYLVISSDGIFQTLNAQHVCQLLEDPSSDVGFGLSEPCKSPLSECLLRTAYEEGSTDNLSVIVVPLREVLDGKQSQL